MTETNKHLFCFGLGYSALVFARRLLARGWKVSGTVRPGADKDRGKIDSLQAEGITVWPFDREAVISNVDKALEGVTHILTSVPPDAEGDTVFDHHATDILACKSLSWFGYLSTTGVYGNRDGGLVHEEDSLHPSSTRSQRRAKAELQWQQLFHDENLPLQIFRLAGIYGPGRSPLEGLRSGRVKQRINKPGHIFSRIHVEDIANVLEASLEKPDPGRIYNVCDNVPEEPWRVTTRACELIGITPPPLVAFEEAEMTPMARSFWLDNKRVDNSRILHELGVVLQYPDYETGLQSLL
ncbi:SDR family oxidoreductase [Kiloniella laminariae]|uniref:SDR family oxidoreductase n=1 Tax=Kiloniella laminariae TaxID=454162 RepID=UPI00035C5EC9|nr:SDR family oxidoreductase [Kiloniella laminariae]